MSELNFTVRQFIEAAYEKLLLRPIDSFGVEHWGNALLNDPRRASEFLDALLGGQEFTNMCGRFLQSYVAPERIPFITDNSQFGELKILLGEMISRSVRHKIVIDCGAYGRDCSNSYDLMRHFGWRGLLIEPSSSRIEIIRREFAGLDYDLVPVAAASYTGTATLHIGAADGVSSIHRGVTEAVTPIVNTLEVAAERLPDILERHKIPKDFGLLSIDAEGEGHNLLNDAVASGYRPTWVIIEVFEGLNVKTLDDQPLSDEVKASCRIVGRTFPNLILEVLP